MIRTVATLLLAVARLLTAPPRHLQPARLAMLNNDPEEKTDG
jgi:hypothetical protein